MNKVMWYAVWVRSGQEDRILELCKTFRHYHPDAYEECFMPTYEKYRKVKGQPTKQLAHLLPGYLFFVSDHPQELQKLLKELRSLQKHLVMMMEQFRCIRENENSFRGTRVMRGF